MIAVTDCSATISSLLSALTKEDACPKVILYSLNPADFDMLGTILGAFQDDEIPGKIQLAPPGGSATLTTACTSR